MSAAPDPGTADDRGAAPDPRTAVEPGSPRHPGTTPDPGTPVDPGTASRPGPAVDPGSAASGPGWTLALDTATPATVAAALGPDGATAARIDTPPPGDRPGHTRLLLGMAEEVLAATGGTWARLDRIVVGLGPGTFTGIRVGVATARALALTHGAHVVGVATPAALAEAASGPAGAGDGRPVLVVQDARRRELFLTVVAPGPRTGEAVVPWTVPQDGLVEALAGLDPRPALAVGDGALAHADVLRAAGVAVPTDPAAHAVDGLALIRAAGPRAPEGPANPLAAADLVRPLYVRGADAVPTADRR